MNYILRVMPVRSAAAIIVACMSAAITEVARPASAAEIAGEAGQLDTSVACAGQIFIAQNGVALSKFPSRSRVSTTVTVGFGTGESAACWTAQSSKAWLKVAPSSATGHSLVLTAVAKGLAADAAHSAVVTVLPRGSATGGATIRVSFWVGSTDPGTVTLAQSAASMATNPVDPLVYVSIGNGAIGVFNVYTGTLIATFNHVAPTVGTLTTSSDGTILFAADTTNYRIVALNASTGKLIKRYSLVGPLLADFSFAYARPGGIATLFSPGQDAIDVVTGDSVSAPITGIQGSYDPLIVATPDGSKLAVVERGLSPGSLYTYQVGGTRGNLTINPLLSRTIEGENCQALALTRDGLRLYPACGWPYQFDVYDGKTLAQVQTLPAAPYPDIAVVDSEGDFVGGINGLYQTDDVFVFNRQGYSVGEVPTTPMSASTGQGNDLLGVSGDATRVISATNAAYGAQTLMFREMP